MRLEQYYIQIQICTHGGRTIGNGEWKNVPRAEPRAHFSIKHDFFPFPKIWQPRIPPLCNSKKCGKRLPKTWKYESRTTFHLSEDERDIKPGNKFDTWKNWMKVMEKMNKFDQQWKKD